MIGLVTLFLDGVIAVTWNHLKFTGCMSWIESALENEMLWTCMSVVRVLSLYQSVVKPVVAMSSYIATAGAAH
jgi:hypothetical protein